MKKTIFILAVALNVLMPAVYGQGEEKTDKKERLEALRVAFITKELSLTSEEAEKFWPVYNEREAEQEELRKQMRENMKGKNLDELTDAEVEKIIEKQIELRQKELDIDKKYLTKMKTVIPVKKVAKLHHAERKFKEEVIQHWREQHHKGEGGHGGKGKGPGGK